MATHSNIALLPVEGDLNASTVPAIQQALETLVAGGCKRVVLNLGQVERIDAAGLGLVVWAVRYLREHGGLVSLTNVRPHAMRTLSRVRLLDFVPVSGVDDAASSAELDPAVLPLWRTVLRIDPANLAATRRHVGALIDRIPLSADDAFDLGLATGEAIGNAVDHAGGCSLVEVSCYKDRAIVEVSDCGEGFDPTAVPAMPAEASPERGRGIALMRLLADDVRIVPKPSGVGMVVRIVKLIR